MGGVRSAARAYVARDLGQLVGGYEHAIVALVFQVQVVARHVRHRARRKAGEARHAMVLVHDDVARAQVGERAQRPAAGTAAPEPVRAGATLGPASAQQPVLGEHGELELGRHEPLAQRGRGEAQRGLQSLVAGVDVLGQPRRFQTPEVVGGALAFAAPGERDHRAVAGAHELLQLRLGFRERASARVGGLRPQLDLLAARVRRQPCTRPLRERRPNALGAHVQVMGVLVAERSAHVAPSPRPPGPAARRSARRGADRRCPGARSPRPRPG